MTTSEDKITRGHEHYLRHLLLLGQAAPVCLKAILERKVSKRHEGNLAQLIVEKKDTFNNYHNAEFLLLFQDDKVTINIDSWDTRLLCVVILVLFKPCLTTAESEAIACVSDQRKDLDNYAHSASLSYTTFETKWDTLHSKMLILIEGIDDEAKFECKRMIHSFKSEPIRVNRELINRMKQTNDVNQHVQMAIEDKVAPKIHGEQEDSCDENERTAHQYDTPVFTESLQDKLVYIDESAVLTCKLNVSDKAVKWQHDSKAVEETDNLMVVSKKDMHWLAISRAELTDNGRYICVCENTSTEAFLKITGVVQVAQITNPTGLSKKPLKIVENLHVATTEDNVRMNEDIVVSCLVDRHTNEPVWRHNDKEIESCDRRHIFVHELEHRLTIYNATFEDEGDYTVDFGDATSSIALTFKDPPEFTKDLQDTFVNVGESTFLTCKLNAPKRAVKWRHNYKLVQETDNLKLARDRYTHWLAISNAKLPDAGHYSCSCGNTSTTASLKVSDIPLTITKGLHVATEEADIREKMDIVLNCAVNLHTNNVIWRHEGKPIKPSNRHVVSVQDLEHKLTIMNAKFGDEGEYTVVFGEVETSAYLTLKGNLSLLHKKQLTEDMYRNWIRGALGLKYLKLGLEGFADNSVKFHHVEITKGLPCVGKVCTACTADYLLPLHKPENCPKKSKCQFCKQRNARTLCINGGFCSTLCDLILRDHRFYDPLLANTNVPDWSQEPWSVATCYINTPGYKGKLTVKEVDCSGLLSLFINNKFIHRSLGDVEINGKTDLFKQARDVRNDILHNANYELSEGQFNDCLDLFKSVLEIKDANGNSPLSVQPGVQKAIDNLNELQNNQIDIRMSKDFQKEINDLKADAKSELAKKVEESERQNRIKLQNLTDELKESERNLQLMRDLRSTDAKSKDSKEEKHFELELRIQANRPTGETSTEGNRRIYQSITDHVSKHSSETYTTSTDQTIYRLLDFITTIKDCEIAAVTKPDIYVYIKIHCRTCEGINEFLKLINGNEFRNETIELRKSLEKVDHIKTDDIVVSCSSESIDNTKKRVYKRVPTNDFSCGKHQGTQCTWYCSDHDKFCCSTCKDSDHRTCVGIHQVVSERSYRKQKQSLTCKRKIKKYNVKLKSRLFKESDDDDCLIRSIYMLPDGNILLVDNGNEKLKKLDSSYNVVSHCDIPYIPYDVCYIGDDRAAICLRRGRIQFVNVLDSMMLEQVVKLGHPCDALACHGDTLYVRGEDTIYTYNRDCQQKHVIYKSKDLEKNNYLNGKVAVSDDGERLYITCGKIGLMTINKTGSHLFTLKTDGLRDCVDFGIVGDGSVLVLDEYGCGHQADYSGTQVLGTVVKSDGIESQACLCYDRQQCRIIVAGVVGKYITVFKLGQY